MNHYNAKEWLNVFLSVAVLPSILIYSVFIWVLLKYRKELESRFFHLSISVGVADLVSAVMIHYYKWVLVIGKDWPSDVRKAARYFQFCISNGSTIAQNSGVLVLTFNRFSVIMWPRKSKQRWKGTWALVTGVTLQWLPCFLYIIAQLSLPIFQFYPDPANSTDRLGYKLSVEGYRFYYSLFVLFYAVIATLTVVMYTLMCVRIVKMHRHRHLTVHTAAMETNATEAAEKRLQDRRRERKLALVGFVLSVMIIYYAVTSLVGFLAHRKNAPRMELQQFLLDFVDPVVDFVFAFSNPYLILAMSSVARGCFGKFLKNIYAIVRSMFFTNGNQN